MPGRKPRVASDLAFWPRLPAAGGSTGALDDLKLNWTYIHSEEEAGGDLQGAQLAKVILSALSLRDFLNFFPAIFGTTLLHSSGECRGSHQLQSIFTAY